jgi:hypothetical protein
VDTLQETIVRTHQDSPTSEGITDKYSQDASNQTRTMEFNAKKDDKVTLTGRIVLSADGRSRTVTTSATDANGKKISNTAVYDKQ